MIKIPDRNNQRGKIFLIVSLLHHGSGGRSLLPRLFTSLLTTKRRKGRSQIHDSLVSAKPNFPKQLPRATQPKRSNAQPSAEGRAQQPGKDSLVRINGEVTQFIHPHWLVSVALGGSEEEKVWRQWPPGNCLEPCAQCRALRRILSRPENWNLGLGFDSVSRELAQYA